MLTPLRFCAYVLLCGLTLGVLAAQPDVLVRTSPEAIYTGDNVYNITGVGQTKALTVPVGKPAVYLFKLVNDGPTSDSFTLTATAGDTAWNVQYFAMSSNAPLTDQLTASGFTVSLSPGGSIGFYVRVIPNNQPNAGTAKALFVSAVSTTQPGILDVAKVVTTVGLNTVPDLQARNNADVSFIGDNLYNLTGTGQTKAQTIQPGSADVYVFRVQNDGNSVDAFTLTGTAGGTGWTAAYAAGDIDITGQVTGSGWSTGELARGAVVDVRLTVSALPLTPALASKSLALIATSQRAATGKDLARAITKVALKVRPDLMLRGGNDASYTGDNIYSTDGTGQTVPQTVAPNTAATFLFKVENEGNSSDTYIIKSPGGATGWSVKYYVMSTNVEITDQVTGTGWPVSLSPGGSAGFYVKVIPSMQPIGGSERTVPVAAISTKNAAISDVVKAVTRVSAKAQPDLSVRTGADTLYAGDNLYNLDGTNQTKALAIAPGAVANYVFKVQNDGNTADTFTLKAPAGNSIFTVKYFAANVGEITTAITGAGWTTSTLPPVGTAGLWATVTPVKDALPNTTFPIVLSAVSQLQGTQKDVVKAITSVLVNYQADLWIRTADEGTYSGNDIINLTGLDQSKALAVSVGAIAPFLCKVNNDGNTADVFTIKGTASSITGWVVQYGYNTVTPTDITADVTGAGWQVSLPRNGTLGFGIAVSPLSIVPDGAMYTVTVTAASNGNVSKKDVIKATATKVTAPSGAPTVVWRFE